MTEEEQHSSGRVITPAKHPRPDDEFSAEEKAAITMAVRAALHPDGA
jgi:hypothetical protein